MKNNKKILLASVLMVTGIVSLTTANSALAYRGDPAKTGPNYTIERHEAMTKALATGDYNAWKSLMSGRGRVSQVVNQNNFAKFVEAHNLALQGKYVEAKAIRNELGLELNNGSGTNCGQGMGRGLNSR